MPVNDQDTVLPQGNGIPTYHFAHVVDDHLMRTTMWSEAQNGCLPCPYTSSSLKAGLGASCLLSYRSADETGRGWQQAQALKAQGPGLSLDFYRKMGYHPAAVREYLMTILNSNFEEWRIANPQADIDEFEFTTEKMSNWEPSLT